MRVDLVAKEVVVMATEVVNKFVCCEISFISDMV